MENLKPCPFCGSYDLGCESLFRLFPDFADNGNQWVMQCRECDIKFIMPTMPQPKLVGYWNRRPNELLHRQTSGDISSIQDGEH